MIIREKVIKRLNDFLTRNKNYTIEVYIKNTDTDSYIEKNYVPSDRNWDFENEKEFKMLWHNGCYSIKIPYKEISACYEGVDKYNQQDIHIILENGLCIEFECVGMKI